MLFRKTVPNFIVPKNFTELQVNYTKLEAQYFLSLIKNESFNGSIYSIDIDSDELFEKSNSLPSMLYYKSSNSCNSKTKEISESVIHQSSKRDFSNTNNNNIQNYSHKRICIKLDS